MIPPAVPSFLGRLRELHVGWTRALAEELPGAVALRERLHAEPMLSGEEEPTARTVEAALGVAMHRLAATGRIGRLGPASGPAVAMRAELDALPITEATDASFAAPSGRMHACGHDIHLAALVAVVRAAHGLELPLGLVPLLQPREETYPSGAKDVVASSWFADLEVAAAIGAHVHPGVPTGFVATGPGAVNAAADEIEIVVHGHGGHGAYPHRASDPVAAIAHILLAIPEVVRRTVSPMHPSTVSVGHLHAGDRAANVLPSRARLLGTIRTTHPEDRQTLHEALRRLATNQASAFGLAAEVSVTGGEPVLYNDPALTDSLDRWLEWTGVEPTEPMRSLGADDFSYFCDVVPSVMCFVGVDMEGDDPPPQLHHPRFLPTSDAVVHVASALIAGYLAAVETLTARPPLNTERERNSSHECTPRR